VSYSVGAHTEVLEPTEDSSSSSSYEDEGKQVPVPTATATSAASLSASADAAASDDCTASGGSTLGPGGTDPQILPRPPKFLDTVVLLLVELIGSIVNFA